MDRKGRKKGGLGDKESWTGGKRSRDGRNGGMSKKQ